MAQQNNRVKARFRGWHCRHDVPITQDCLACEDERGEEKDEMGGSMRRGMRGFTGGAP